MIGRLLIGGEWVTTSEKLPVYNPYSGDVVAEVYAADAEEVAHAIAAVKKGFNEISQLPAHKRASILRRVSELISERKEELAKTIALESGKTIREARTEVERACQTFLLSAEEAKRVTGEVIPFDAVSYGEHKFGFYIREPVGLVLAITPFNFPLNLVAHKLGPAFAAGDAVVLKPSTVTPMTALKLGEILLEAGLPPNALAILVGKGEVLGDMLVKCPEFRVVTFTGSLAVANEILRKAGFKRVIIEAGSNSAAVVMEDADLSYAVTRIKVGGFAVAGQVCISVQRVYVDARIYDEFKDRLVAEVRKMKVGNPLDEATDMGPMISEAAARRLESWIDEAVNRGAKVIIGGERKGTLFYPTLMENVPEDVSLFREEAFGPVILLYPYDTIEDAIRGVNNTKYGLQAGVFTNDYRRALDIVRRVEVGGVMINDVPTYRADQMPYGGVKHSGLGREGPRFAIEELTEIKVITFDMKDVRRNG